MSNKKEEINLDINTELSDDEFEDFDETLSEDNDEINDAQNEEENEDETMQESEMEELEDIDGSKNKSNFEDSISKSEIDRDISETFLDDDDDFDDIEEEDIVINIDEEINENLQVNDEDRISRNILTKYEMVRLIGTRAKQISDGSKVFVKYDGVKSAIELAELEIKYKMLPLKIKRPLPNGKYEIWKISELDILENF